MSRTSLAFSDGFTVGADRSAASNIWKVFDFAKALEIIQLKKPILVTAGLDGDWDCTSDTILEGGKLVSSKFIHLASKWATPSMTLVYDDGQVEEVDCYKEFTHQEVLDNTTLIAQDKWSEEQENVFNKPSEAGASDELPIGEGAVTS